MHCKYKVQKVYAKLLISPISCLTPISKRNFPFFPVRANFRSLIPPLIRGGDIHYEHILLFIEIQIVQLFNQVKEKLTLQC